VRTPILPEEEVRLMKAKHLLPIGLLSALVLVTVLLVAVGPAVAQEPLLRQIQASVNPDAQVGLVMWEANTEVVIEINDLDTAEAVDFSVTGATDDNGDFGTGFISFDMEAGDVVTVTQGGTVDTLIVRDISITEVDREADIVHGTADPDSDVRVSTDYLADLWVIANSIGEWMADFSGVYDIVPGTHLDANQSDADSDLSFTILDVPLPPVPISAGTSITTPSRGTVTSGTPTVYWEDPITVSTTGLSGGTGSATLAMPDGYAETIALVESPPGTYTGTFLPVYPDHHGTASITITIHYPVGDDQEVYFTLYIDPSGVVRDTFGDPVAGATVTLYRSANADGPFLMVPDGSTIMGPGNRTNPDVAGADGLFGWDVAPGYYKVRAEKAGYSAPGGNAFVETAVLRIPPPVTDLVLVLYCPSVPAVTIESVLHFFDQAAEDGTLVGSGRGILGKLSLCALHTELLLAKACLDRSRESAAVVILKRAYAHCDGLPRPTDLVKGPARPELAGQIQQLIADLSAG